MITNARRVEAGKEIRFMLYREARVWIEEGRTSPA
jgi:hypothetical protein